MDDREYDFWLRYIRGIADRLGLKDWDLRLSRESCADENGATIFIWYGQKRATINLKIDLYRHNHAEAREDQRRNIVHELLHCQFEMFEQNRLVAATFDDRTEREKLQDAFDTRAIELVIDNLATVWARFFELPAWSDAR